MNTEHKEFYTKYLSSAEQMFLRTTPPLSTETQFGKECFNVCISSALEATEDSAMYSNLIGLIYFYE